MRRPEPRAAGTEPRKNLLTPAGHKRIVDEVTQLRTVERPKMVQEVQDAAAQGDRSENAEYKYGKLRLRDIDKRLNFLMSRLKHATVIDPATQQSDRVLFGAYVEAEDEHGTLLRYQLVGVDESKPEEGRLSLDSPLGRALANHREGDTVTFVKPRGGPTEVTIVRVSYGAKAPWSDAPGEP